MRDLTVKPANIRHITIISEGTTFKLATRRLISFSKPVGNGKRTLEDFLLAKAGLIVGTPLQLDHDPQLRINDRDSKSIKIQHEMVSLCAKPSYLMKRGD